VIKILLPLVLSLFAPIAANGESPPPPGSLALYIQSGKLTPDNAAKHPPLEYLARLQHSGEYNDFPSTQYQQKAEAAFLTKYADQLRTLTDSKIQNPEILRPKLVSLLLTLSEFQYRFDGHRQSYDKDRAPAYAEWLLCSSNSGFFAPHPGTATINEAIAPISKDDIRAFIRILSYAREELQISAAEETIRDCTPRILDGLADFESHLNEAGKQHFRTEIVRFMDQSFR
jgi:hypothetical protein